MVYSRISVKNSARSKASKMGRANRRMKRRTAKLAAPVRKAVARVARRALHPETKHVSGTIVDDDFNSSISTASECYSIIPQVPLGDEDWQRSGNKISNAVCYIKGSIQYDSGKGDPKVLYPATVRLMVLEQKNQKDCGSIGSRTAVNSLLDPRIGQDDPIAYTGVFPSNQSPINTDMFKVYADRKYSFKWDYTGNFGTAGAAAGTNKTINFTIKVRLPKVLTFDPSVSSANQPTNSAPFLCLGYQYDTATPPDWFDTPFRVRVLSTMYYKDV